MPILVPHSEMPGSPAEQWTEDGFRATVNVRCAWGVRNLLALQAYYELYPRIPQTLARATSIQVKPFDAKMTADPAGSQYACYEQALVTIQYTTTGPETEDLVSESIEGTTEYLDIDTGPVRWGAVDGAKVGDVGLPGVLMRGHAYVLTFHKLRALPMAVLELEGCCNSNPVPSRTLGRTYPPETLLYAPPQISRKMTSEMIEAFQATFRFSYKPNGWNKFYNPATKQYERLYRADGGGQPEYYYDLGDFAALRS